MEVEELSPVAQSSSLTPVERASEEDDGFVDILESDLKVNSLGPQAPTCSPLGQPRQSARLQPYPNARRI
jgi:hypothetical protein